MGKLIVMPSRNTQDRETKNVLLAVAEDSNREHSLAAGVTESGFSIWNQAPRERTADYFPVYSAVSRAMQAAMRVWVREWFSTNMEILQRPHAAYAVLVYLCTHPFAGRPTNIFTYEIQQTDTLHRAFRSAANKLGRYLKSLDTKRLPWFTREYYFAYRSNEVVNYVSRNPRVIYRILHVETMLMDAILRFSITDLPTIGMEESLIRLRRTFRIQLHRFSDQFDLSPRTEELLRIATDALVSKMTSEAAERVPNAA